MVPAVLGPLTQLVIPVGRWLVLGRSQGLDAPTIGCGRALGGGLPTSMVESPVVDSGAGPCQKVTGPADRVGVVGHRLRRRLGPLDQLRSNRAQAAGGKVVGGSVDKSIEGGQQCLGIAVRRQFPRRVTEGTVDGPVLPVESGPDQPNQAAHLLAALAAVVDVGSGLRAFQVTQTVEGMSRFSMSYPSDCVGHRLLGGESKGHVPMVVIRSNGGETVTLSQLTHRLPRVDPWAAVVGQTEALARLEQAAVNPVHAYLLLGRRGYGTHQAALGFAGLVLAASVDQGDNEAGRERALKLALDANHPDLMVFRPEGAALRVPEAEEIIRAGLRTPIEGSRKVIIVDGVDAIQTEAIGKLLKVVEEPPPSTVFVMLADTIPPEIVTIASRCVPVEFGPLPSAELEQALVAEGADPERAAVAAMAAGGDVDRARLLVTDDALAGRAALWQSIPDELNGTGSRACELVDQVREGMDAAQGPLGARQAIEMEQLEARVEQLGERGSGRADLVAQHKREIRRLRTDELVFGLAVMSRVYRDRLVAGYDPSAETALDAIQAAAENLVRNPNETLLLQDLFLKLAPAPAAR